MGGGLLWPFTSEVTVPTGELLLRLCVVKRETIEVDVAGALKGEKTQSAAVLSNGDWVRELWCPSCSMLILFFKCQKKNNKKWTSSQLLWNVCLIEGKVLSLKKYTKKILSGYESAFFFGTLHFQPHSYHFTQSSKQTQRVVFWLALRMSRTVGASSWPTRSLCQFILLNHLVGRHEKECWLNSISSEKWLKRSRRGT